MKRKITKTKITITIDNDLSNKIAEIIYNKSNYVENLIYQDLLKKNTNGIEKIII